VVKNQENRRALLFRCFGYLDIGLGLVVFKLRENLFIYLFTMTSYT